MNFKNDKKNIYGKAIMKDSQEHALHTTTGHNDPKFGLSYDHIQPKVEDIKDVKDHPAYQLPKPTAGGELPVSSVSRTKGAPQAVRKNAYGPSEGKKTHGGAPWV